MQSRSAASEVVSKLSTPGATASAGVLTIPPINLGTLSAEKPAETHPKNAAVESVGAPGGVAVVAPASQAAPSLDVVGKVRAKELHVEKSHSSFGKLNSMLHSFTSSKGAKNAAVKKTFTLSDAQIANIRYTSKTDFAGSALHILHQGTNSIFYIATAQETGLKLLLKAYDIGKMTDQELAAVRGEIEMLTRLKHDGIAGCRGSWQDEKHLYSVEEYGIRGDLFIEMFSDRQRLSERFIACKVLKPLLSALVYIHGHNIVHRSILPENLHFDKDLTIKLTHFASAVDLSQAPAPCHSASVVDYLAPEVLKCISSVTSKPAVSLSDAQDNIQLFPFGSEYASAPSRVPPLRQKGGYDQKADIWAVGCLLFELLTGKGPFELASKELTCALILWGDIQHFPEKLSQPCVAFIQACLIKDPKKRPSAEQLLQHDWLVKQVQAEADGVPEGMEFQPAEQQNLVSSSTWLSRQMAKLRKRNSSTHSSDSIAAARSSPARLHMPRLCRRHVDDIETGSGDGLQSYARMFSN